MTSVWRLAVGGAVALALMLALAASAFAATIYAVRTDNHLVRFDSATPGTLTGDAPIIGLQIGESLLALDCRPATGQLLALGSTNRLYTINTVTGVATEVGTPGQFTLNGSAFGFDVNPVVDRIRVVSDADQNIRLNPSTGALTATDIALSYVMGDPNFGQNPNVVGSAYSNNVAGAMTTTLYGIDSNLDILVTQTNPNGGLLATNGALGVDTTDLVGFDIAQDGTAYASLTAPGAASSALYTINLTTGAATLVGTIGGGVTIRGLTAACGALAARVSGLAAVRTTRGVVVRWRTGAELNTVGFNVYRSQHGRRVRVNRHVIPALSVTRGGISGGSYSFLDRGAPRHHALSYWLQAVNTGGARTWHGPVRVAAS